MIRKAFLALVLSAFAFSANAVPDLGTVMGDPTYAGILDTGDELFKITDADGVDDDVTGLLVLELAGFSGVNESFIYAPFDPSKRLSLFLGPDGVLDSVVLTFDIFTGTWDNGFSPPIDLGGPVFGLGLTSPDGTFFSQTALNVDGVDHLATYATEGAGGLLGAFQYTFAWEDVLGGGDLDYNDHVFAATDVMPFQVNETGTLALASVGLLCLFRRRLS